MPVATVAKGLFLVAHLWILKMSEERVGKCPKGSVLIVPPEMEKIGLLEV